MSSFFLSSFFFLFFLLLLDLYYFILKQHSNSRVVKKEIIIIKKIIIIICFFLLYYFSHSLKYMVKQEFFFFSLSFLYLRISFTPNIPQTLVDFPQSCGLERGIFEQRFSYFNQGVRSLRLTLDSSRSCACCRRLVAAQDAVLSHQKAKK